ncbi:tyrosine recombinase XerC [Microbacterium sp. NPDC056052]|uniref:site-specific integrase n=1 Tax=Microbacterium sp. NPDC056052 TaxID=3345695 RepID=UPI0035D657D4
MTTATTTKKRKTREAFGQIKRMRSGRLQASYIGPDGVRHYASTTFDKNGLTAAREFLAGVRTRIAAGTWKSPTEEKAERERRDVLFSVFAEDWLTKRHNVHAERLKATTEAEYRRLISGPLAAFADMAIPAISKAAIMDWRSGQLDTGRVTQTSRAYSLLRSIMQDAVDRELIARNPCQIKGAGSATSKKSVKPPTADELAIIVANLPERYKAMALLAAWSGLRYGELTELRRKDVRITRKHDHVVLITLHVSRAVTHVTGKGAIVGKPKTAAGIRDVKLPNVSGLYATVIAHLANQVIASPDALLFPSAGDPTEHMRQSSLARVWMRAREKAGRKDLPWHGLRHYAASAYSAAGATPVEVMERLGQASPGIALRYTHGTGREDALLEKMSSIA